MFKIALAALFSFVATFASAQPRLQIPEETTFIKEFYKSSAGDFIELRATLWRNDRQYDQQTSQYLTQARQEIAKRGYVPSDEREYHRALDTHGKAEVGDSRSQIFEIQIEYWPSPGSWVGESWYIMKEKRETFLTIKGSAWSKKIELPRSQANSQYIFFAFANFDEMYGFGKELNEKQVREYGDWRRAQRSRQKS